MTFVPDVFLPAAMAVQWLLAANPLLGRSGAASNHSGRVGAPSLPHSQNRDF